MDNKKLVIEVWHDDSAEDPSTEDWTPYSFSRRHSNYRDPQEFEDSAELKEKLAAGLAFPLSYYEHGMCCWSLEEASGCPWDWVGHAGYLVWEREEGELGPETLEDRRADAKAFIERYTLWCNGEVYGYSVKTVKGCASCGHEEIVGDDLPSCGGYLGNEFEAMACDIRGQLDLAGVSVRFEGDPSSLLQDVWEQKVPA